MDDNASDAAPEAPKSKKGLIFGALGALLLGGGGLAAGMLMSGGNAPDDAAEATIADGEETPAAPAGADAIYHGIHPPLLINFLDDRGKSRFLQISLEVMTRDEAVVEALKTHNAVIRNNLILLYGDIDYATVSGRDGKAGMLASALEEINGVLQAQTGAAGIEAVYFTNLVVQ